MNTELKATAHRFAISAIGIRAMMIDKEDLSALIEWHDARQAIFDRSPMDSSRDPWLRLANAEHALHKIAHDLVKAYSEPV